MTDTADGTFDTFLSRIHSKPLLAVAQLWNKARGNKQMPSWDDLPTSALLPYAKLLWGFRYDPVAGELTGSLAGDKISKWVGSRYDGSLSDLRTRYKLGAMEEHLIKCATTPLAARYSGRLFKVETFIVTGERINLPMATDGQKGDGIFGASDYISPPLLGPVELIHENVEWYAL